MSGRRLGAPAGQHLDNYVLSAPTCCKGLACLACRDVCQPEVELATHTSWVTSGCWLAEPQGILLTQDDGALRWAALNPFTRPKHEHKTQGSWW